MASIGVDRYVFGGENLIFLDERNFISNFTVKPKQNILFWADFEDRPPTDVASEKECVKNHLSILLAKLVKTIKKI